MSFGQLMRILWARKGQFLLLSLFIVASVAVASLVLPKKYIAESAVVVDTNNADPVNERNQSQEQPSIIATQMDIIASRNVALKVIDDLKLQDDPRFKQAYAEAEVDISIRDWLVTVLLDKLTVRSTRNGNVIYIDYTSIDPALAARVADAFSASYIMTVLELRVEPARRQTEWFDKQVKTLREQYEAAQQKLSAYQSEHGVIGIEEAKLDAENARLDELTNQMVLAQATASANKARAAQMDEASTLNRPDELSDILKSPLMQNLKTELARAESKFADVSQRFDRNHPQYLSAAAELASMQKKVAHEMENARGTVMREASIAQQQASNLQRAVEQQRARIISLRGTQDSYATLKHEADVARDAYETAMKRNSQTNLESRMDFTNIAVLNSAAIPTSPSSPKLVLNLALAVLFGPLLAAALVLANDRRVRVVHSADDIEQHALGTVLAEVPRPTVSIKRTRRAAKSMPVPMHVEPRLS